MTTTMLETFDTQMVDYQNDDYSMHVSSSDAWFQDEATMEDDGHPLEHESISIEVEMESYDDDHDTEYEMVDGSKGYELDSNEPLDVEVYDASRINSPAPILSADTPTTSPSDAVDHPYNPQESIENHSPAPSSLPPPNTKFASPSDDDNDVLDLSRLAPSFSEHGESRSDTHTDGPMAGQLLPPPALETTNVQEIIASGYDPTLVVTEQNDLQEYEGAGQQEAELVGAPGSPDTTDVELPIPVVQSSSQDGADLPTDEQGGQNEEGPNDSTPALSPGDPHEIYEGVYIDPPPPVLLSFMAELPQISLFNAPSQPESSSSNESYPEITVLLAHLPTLYYEPLFSVFEAIRQDEHFEAMTELSNGELALEAYDLELTLSEDNLYSREVSLHDLNVLHDGLNKPGPLRMRLRAETRFIIRYHQLQEQVAQLSIADLHPEDQPHIPQNGEDQGSTPGQPDEDVNDGNEASSLDPVKHSLEAGYKEPHQETDYQADAPEDIPLVKDHEESAVEKVQEHVNENLNDESAIEVAPREAVDDFDDLQSTAADGVEEEEDDIIHEYPETMHEYDETHLGQENVELFEGQPHEAFDEATELNTDVTETSNHTPQPPEFDPDQLDRLTTGVNHELPEGSNPAQQEAGLKESGSTSTNPESFPDLDASEYDFTAPFESNTILADNEAGPSTQDSPFLTDNHENTDAEHDTETWDDDLDGEGDPDTLWELEHETSSNQSSTTLSSNTTSKRNISEVDVDEEDLQSPPSSPDPKRLRVQ